MLVSMRAASFLVTALATLAVLATRARDAEACSPPSSEISGRTVVPEDGAASVPTNARVLIEYDTGGDGPPEPPQLRVQGGALVPVQSKYKYLTSLLVWVLQPNASLEPATTYEVLDVIRFACPDPFVASCVGEPAVIATFVTAAGPDTIAPRSTGFTSETWFVVNQGTTCKNDDAVVQRVSIETASDDGPPEWLRFEYLDAMGTVRAGPLPLVTVGRDCGGGVAGSWDYELGMPAGAFSIRVVDLGGNVEAESHLLYAPTCEEARPQPMVDAGASPDGGAPVEGGGDGCGCATNRGGGGWLVLAMLALLLRSRRR